MLMSGQLGGIVTTVIPDFDVLVSPLSIHLLEITELFYYRQFFTFHVCPLSFGSSCSWAADHVSKNIQTCHWSCKATAVKKYLAVACFVDSVTAFNSSASLVNHEKRWYLYNAALSCCLPAPLQHKCLWELQITFPRKMDLRSLVIRLLKK